MRQPDDVLRILRERFERDYPSWAQGQGCWPWPIPLHPPNAGQRAEDPIGCHRWAAGWADYTGPGTLEFSMRRFPTGRRHSMPTRLLLAHPRDVAAAHPPDRDTWRRCGQRLTGLQREFPNASYRRLIRRVTELTNRDFERLATTAHWLRDNPTSGMLLRQLPIEGIDTKWLLSHASLVLALLGDAGEHGHDHVETDGGDPADDPPADKGAAASRRRALHLRLGLRVPPDLIQVSVCDTTLRAQAGGMRHFAASVEDLNQWKLTPTAVAVLENKETGYAVTDELPGTVILHGHGRYVEQYARIRWIRAADRVVYWGDLDVPGLEFVSDLRAHGVPARTILTDLPTLERYRHLAVDAPHPRARTIPAHLTEAEQILYRYLLAHAADHGTGLVLEQERIPWAVAQQELRAALLCG